LVGERTEQLRHSYESTLQALVTALDFRDNETQGHSTRVVEYAVLVAGQMEIEEPLLTTIRWGSILHDVGKIGIPDDVLLKPGKLNEEEWITMKRHPEMGFRMLQHIAFLKPSLDIIFCHQERFDGTGYPRGLKGEQIPLGARVFAVVDTFDAMTSDRPYRAALSIDVACEEIDRCSGTQFDPDVARAFLAIDAERWRIIRQRVHEETVAIEERIRRVMNSR
jgi:HD-GYP domain-containing protein (c-di-GMP phosphodiesterase class II)